MRSLVEHPTTSLHWRRSGFNPPDYELLGSPGVYATLTFLNDEHTLARIKTLDGNWTLKHLGLLNPVVTLRQEGGGTNLATFHPHAFRNGVLSFLDGTDFDWAWLHAAGPGGAFLDRECRAKVHLHVPPAGIPSPTTDYAQCEVALGSAPSADSQSILLAAMGWYLLLFDHLKERDGAHTEAALEL